MTRVLVDLLFFTGTKGGMESYVHEVYGRIAANAPDLEFVALASRELAATDHSWFPGTVIDSGISGENRTAWALGELFRVSGFARRLHADLIHSPANFGPAWPGVPVVVTVHDLLPFRHPEYVLGPYSRILRTMIRLASRRARRVLTDSTVSRDDISRYLHIPANRIDVIPLAGSTTTASATLDRLPDQLLAVGNRMPHKNFPMLLEALALIPEESRPRLVITGSHGDDPLAPIVRQLGLDRWVDLRGWIPLDDLDDLYARSTIMVFPTLFEGFGLPALEAMSRGCPVVASDLPVLREVCGEAALWVNPADAASIARVVTELLDNPLTRDRMSRAGKARAATFSWESTARLTAESLRGAAKDQRSR